VCSYVTTGNPAERIFRKFDIEKVYRSMLSAILQFSLKSSMQRAYLLRYGALLERNAFIGTENVSKKNCRENQYTELTPNPLTVSEKINQNGVPELLWHGLDILTEQCSLWDVEWMYNFIPEDGGSKFLRSVSDLYRTTPYCC
jgi:hypothetical protein